MPIRLDTVLRKVERMSNKVNSDLLKDVYQHMKDNGTSQNYQKGSLKAMVDFCIAYRTGYIILRYRSQTDYQLPGYKDQDRSNRF